MGLTGRVSNTLHGKRPHRGKGAILEVGLHIQVAEARLREQ